MNIDSFFKNYRIESNPFSAEEARLDPVFGRTLESAPSHPDFDKILGQVDKPSTAIVFGEKGSGKTAIRLMLARQIQEHNTKNPQRKILPVIYDDLNPVLDTLLRFRRQDRDRMLQNIRLEDHQDAVLSHAITRLTDALLGKSSSDDDQAIQLPDDRNNSIRQMPRQRRADLAVLAALYDQPRSGNVVERFDGLRRKLRLGWGLSVPMIRYLASFATLAAAVLWIVIWFLNPADQPWWLLALAWVVLVAAAIGWGVWGFFAAKLWGLSRKIVRETPAIERTAGEIRTMLGRLSPRELTHQPLPLPNKSDQTQRDARYQFTRRLIDSLEPLGYRGMIVLVDRVDEPTVVSGEADRMQKIVWPMLDNKFLKQDNVGVKLLLPLELRHALHRESPQFFQEARLDKQNMVDRLSWSGATLYDLASARLRACRPADAESIQLTDLFQPDVPREMIVDALDQMHQPRDAFKFLYAVIQEHCRLVPEDQAEFRIAKLTLDSVRRMQSQRVQELYRGLTPA